MKKNSFSISQNFITSKAIIKRIVARSTIQSEDTVLEIGTGKGHITAELARRSKLVYSVEIDPVLYRKAKQRLKPFYNIRCIHADFLKYSLPAAQQYKVFANIPYSLTTKIIKKLTTSHNPPTDMWLTMEKGAAKRFLGQPNESIKSLLLQPFWDIKIVYHFKRDDFHPKPSVDSVLIYLSQKESPDIGFHELQAFEKFLRYSFQWGLYGKRKLLSKKQISTALKLANLPPLEPAAPISYEQWICLFQCYQKFH
ncbi:23S ribosomal RNA methyltransferase Erm [Gracilibacillus alcaliphilus]|uniref:23S ribosomal RNA methyltransferase Erm n=1 Tax=Gracilibacillus alcaliphilus TaxID=1401441 RepID=UPI00195EFB6B|nr:23S ribosomal RNA methyltransferase Erm [Gracilibacillus alcaliphilus]MBM7677387.1 23S rRNA (adenine-N6)-dimethyltransferase [Gracilibacillus alcaliphilus]